MIDLLLIFVILAGYFVAYIVSLFSLAVYIDPDDIEKSFPGVSARRRRFMQKLVGDPRAFVQVAAICKSFVMIFISVATDRLMSDLAGAYGIEDLPVRLAGLLVAWILYIIIGEYMPRRSARKAISDRMVRFLWLVSLLYLIFLPVVRAYRRALAGILMDTPVTEEEKEDIVERAIETLAEQAGIGESIIEDDKKEMIGNIFLLDQTVAREIMIPRIDVVGIEKSMSFRDIRALVSRDGHSRYPVFDETMDKVMGLIYVKDLFNKLPGPGEVFAISDHLREPYFVPESKVISELLREFKTKHLHIAMVADEYGGVAGLVTLEDIIEEIFGEIQDEHDWEEAEFTILKDGSYLVSPGMLVEELQEKLDTDYEQSDYDTVGGLIYDLVGSVPKEGQRLRWHELEFEVVRVEGQRIISVRVHV